MDRVTGGPTMLGGLDPDIAEVVHALRGHNVTTFESCQGGPGHAYAEPTVAFHGSKAEGFRALATALACGLPVRDLRRVWKVDRGMRGPVWEMTFVPSSLPYRP